MIIMFSINVTITAQKMKYSVKDFFSKYEQTCNIIHIY